jgi:hypothetical protein
MPDLGQTKSTVFDPGSTTVNPVEYARQKIRLQEAQNAMLLEEMRNKAALAREQMGLQERLGMRGMDIQESDPSRRAKAQLEVQGGTGMQMQALAQEPSFRALDLETRKYENERRDTASQRIVDQLQQMSLLREIVQKQRDEYGKAEPALEAAYQSAQQGMLGMLQKAGQGPGSAMAQGGAGKPAGGPRVSAGGAGGGWRGTLPAAPAVTPKASPDDWMAQEGVPSGPPARSPGGGVADVYDNRASTIASQEYSLRAVEDLNRIIADPGSSDHARRRAAESLKLIQEGMGVTENVSQAREQLESRQSALLGIKNREQAILNNPSMGMIFQEQMQGGMKRDDAILATLAQTEEALPGRMRDDLSDVEYFANLDDGGTPTDQHFTAIRQKIQSTYEQFLATMGKREADSYLDQLVAKMAEEFGDSEEDIVDDMNAQESRTLLRFIRSLSQQTEVKLTPTKRERRK